MIVPCYACGHSNEFEQPYAYHAGHGNQGFLYNEAGDRTLVWSSFDPAWESLAGAVHPWTLGLEAWARVEAALHPAPSGGRWRAANPPRCLACRAAIGRGMGDGAISYYVYPRSVLLDDPQAPLKFRSVLTDHAVSDQGHR